MKYIIKEPLFFRRKRKRRDQTTMMGGKESSDRPADFNLPQIPPPLSLLNSTQNSQETRAGSSPGSASSHHSSSQHQHNAVGMSGMKPPHSGAGNVGVYGQEAGGMAAMHVKPEVQQQHSVDSIENGSHTRSPVTPGAQRSPALSHGMGGSLLDTCSRYGISGGISTTTSPECSASGGYGGGSMVSNQQSHNPYLPTSRSSSSFSSSYGHSSHPFNFTVNNLIHRNYRN